MENETGRGAFRATLGAMPRLIDRDANARRVLPVVVRLMAEGGLQAASYRRVAAESGMTVAAIRNMWETQEKLHQRAGATLPEILFRPTPPSSRETHPDDLLRDAIRAMLPLTEAQRVAHRAWLALLFSPPGGLLHLCARSIERTRMTRICMAVARAEWLSRPEPRPAMLILGQDYALLDIDDLTPGTAGLLTALGGTADALARPVETLSPASAERWVRSIRVPLLDFMS